MAIIDITSEGSLLIATVKGNITADEFITIVLENYQSKIVKDVIWDLTNGSMKSISQEGFTAMAKTAKMSLTEGSRRGGKTVFVGSIAKTRKMVLSGGKTITVGSADCEYSLSRMYKVIAEVTGVPVKYNVCKTLEEAKSWIERVE